jgi:hypothetical protein
VGVGSKKFYVLSFSLRHVPKIVTYLHHISHIKNVKKKEKREEKQTDRERMDE